MRIGRSLVVVVALAACAWFAIGVRQALDTSRATAIIAAPGRESPARLRHAGALLQSAGLLNPDTTVDLLRARLALRHGQSARARQIALSVARREPMNLEAWVWYGFAGSGQLIPFLQSLAHLRALDPLQFRLGGATAPRSPRR